MFPRPYYASAYYAKSYFPASGVVTWSGGIAHYTTPYSSYREEQARQRREREARLDDEIALAEQLQQETRLAQTQGKRRRKAARELAATEAQLQHQINALRMERVRLMRQIDDEEAILALLLAWPLH